MVGEQEVRQVGESSGRQHLERRPSGQRPVVSVVMPSLNQVCFIEAAIASALDQAFEDIELVIADGGSKDGTCELLQTLSQRYGDKLRWHSEPDSGPANAVNRALQLARGDVLGWLNSDDLYTPGAIARAVDFLSTHPDTVMVYGEGEHIDAEGEVIEPYPTRPPDVSLSAFQAGCFICQPTVFLRRSALETVGPLDESLATAFDFDLWLRIFQQFPGRIGHIHQVQAQSRLHADCITRTQRRLVAVEGVRLLAKYFGKAPDHWLRTHIDELMATYPFAEPPGPKGGRAVTLSEQVEQFIGELAGYLEPAALAQLQADLRNDARMRLALPGVYAAVYPDGWAPRVLEVRMRGITPHWSNLRLDCVHQWPFRADLGLTLITSWDLTGQLQVSVPGPFAIDIPLGDAPRDQDLTLRLTADRVFVPSQFDYDNGDTRGLAFRVAGLSLS
jgi:glycosyltransferase involved in cell wall biosynthesis